MNILNKLTIKHLRMNKKRTIVTIVGIILSTALMVGIGAIASSLRDNALNEVILKTGDYHVQINEVPYRNLKYITNNVNVEKAIIEHGLGYSYLPNSNNEYKPYLYITEVDEKALKDLKLVSGRLPKNNQEIVLSKHIETNALVTYQIGDIITLDIGKRILPDEYNGESNDQSQGLIEGETLKSDFTRTYTVVGFVERLSQEPYQAPGYTVLTKLDKDQVETDAIVDVMVTYKKAKNVHKKTENIAKNVDLPYQKLNDGKRYYYTMEYNEALLSFYGESSYVGMNDALFGIIAVILGLVMIGCAIVIYNSFAISVMERKKQFGLFSSIGATKKQLRKTVFYEAFLVSLVGIPIGIISGILGIWVVLQITNNLLPDVFSTPLQLSLYPAFIILPIIYMIITIIISAYLPARKASRISPIEAIRLNDDIKVNNKAMRTNKITEKCFGIEGELARKNMKRNKKKYRITILSLVVSIVLFVSFSTFVEYANRSTNSLLEVRSYDILVQNNYIEDKNLDKIMQEALNVSGIDNKFTVRTVNISLDYISGATKEFNKNHNREVNHVTLITLEDSDYEAYLEKLHLNKKEYDGSVLKPILVNSLTDFDYEKMKINKIKVFDNYKNRKVNMIENYIETDDDKPFSALNRKTLDITVVDRMPNEVLEMDFAGSINMIISRKMLENLKQDNISYVEWESKYSFINAKDHAKVFREIEKIITSNLGERNNHRIYFYDITASTQLQKNLVIVIGMFLYGFIALVTLIGVTSVFNTINTSMALRRKEFAVLRSIGLTPKGFNKMLCYESILYGLKALLIGLPISFGVIVLFHVVFMNVVSFDSILIPWKAIIIAIVAVFIITFLTMMYATSKIKKENILEAIREENI